MEDAISASGPWDTASESEGDDLTFETCQLEYAILAMQHELEQASVHNHRLQAEHSALEQLGTQSAEYSAVLARSLTNSNNSLPSSSSFFHSALAEVTARTFLSEMWTKGHIPLAETIEIYRNLPVSVVVSLEREFLMRHSDAWNSYKM